MIVAHSLLAHKEFRFIMPILPIASVLAGKHLYSSYIILLSIHVDLAVGSTMYGE